MSGNAQRPARLVGRGGGGGSGRACGPDLATHTRTLTTVRKLGERPRAVGNRVRRLASRPRKVSKSQENDDAVHEPVRTTASCAAQAIDPPDGGPFASLPR